MASHDPVSGPSTSRRGFLAAAAFSGAALGARALEPSGIFARGRERLRVGLCGCGGRGTGAAFNILDADPAVEIVAMADAFEDRLNESLRNLSSRGDRVSVPPERRFVGFDAYRQLVAQDLDICLFATPPAFRSQHVLAAIQAGKHVFAEKPVAVDPVTVRRFLEAARLAEEKGLAIVTGTQRRHQASYLETMRRIREGEIGEIVAAQCYWNQGALWSHPREKFKTDVEWQMRNWLYFTWLSGDHIVEQHIHNIDVVNWAIGATPLKAIALGGRQARVASEFGHIYDHFAVEFEYPGGVRVHSFCRQQQGTPSRVEERIVGTEGVAMAGQWIKGRTKWRHRDEGDRNPYVQEHIDLIASIRDGRPLNEGRRIAESTLCAVMGRMAAYTGKEVTWDFAMNSQLDIVPSELVFGDMPVPEVATPGVTPLV
ncbi:MAG: Gfo/Idh/MocA family oxidoreductase [Planctomycetota bacterium]